MKFYEETFDAIARIEEPADQALQHFITVRSLFEHGHENGATLLFSDTLKLVRQLKDAKQKLYLYGLCGILLAEQGRFGDAFTIADEIDLLLLVPELLSSNVWKEEVEEKKNLLYATIAEYQARCRQIDGAISTADRVVDFDEYEQTILNIVSQLRPEDFETQTHQKLLEELESPDRLISAFLTLAKNERQYVFNALKKTDEEVDDSAKKDELYHRIIVFLLAEQENVDTIFERIISPTVRVFSLLQMAQHTVNENGVPQNILDQAVTEAHKIEQDQEKRDAFVEIGKTFASWDRQTESRNAFREAIRLVDSQKNDFQKIQSLFKIAQPLCECGERSAALNLYKRATRIVETVEDLYFRCNWFREISRALLYDHFNDEALDIIDRLSDHDQEKNGWNRRELERQSLDFRSMKAVFFHQESLARSQAAKILRDENPQTDEFQTLSDTLITQATDLARKLVDPIWRTEALRSIAEYTDRTSS